MSAQLPQAALLHVGGSSLVLNSFWQIPQRNHAGVRIDLSHDATVLFATRTIDVPEPVGLKLGSKRNTGRVRKQLDV